MEVLKTVVVSPCTKTRSVLSDLKIPSTASRYLAVRLTRVWFVGIRLNLFSLAVVGNNDDV